MQLQDPWGLLDNSIIPKMNDLTCGSTTTAKVSALDQNIIRHNVLSSRNSQGTQTVQPT